MAAISSASLRAGSERMQSFGELIESTGPESSFACWRLSAISCACNFLLALNSVLNHLLQAFHDELVLSIVELAAMPMRFGQGQCGDEHRVVDFDERPVLKQILEQFVCLLLISRHESLIDAFLRLKNGLIAQQNVQEG